MKIRATLVKSKICPSVVLCFPPKNTNVSHMTKGAIIPFHKKAMCLPSVPGGQEQM